MMIIPAIDLREGRVVRLKQGDFAQQRTFDAQPVALAQRYADAGAACLHVVDLDGAKEKSPRQVDTLRAMAAIGVPIQAGGGVRTRADVERLRAAGIARVVVGSIAVRDAALFASWLDDYGSDAFCLALDVRRNDAGAWRPAVDGWQTNSDAALDTLLDHFCSAGLRHVLTTDIARDGMADGPNLALYRELAMRWDSLAWIASGGVRDRVDVDALATTGVAACVAGTALLDGTLALEEIAACSRAA